MNSGKIFLNSLLAAVFIAVYPVSLTGCKSLIKPPVPEVVEDDIPSWDGDSQNSGLIDYIEGKGYLITASAAERYTWLTVKYSKDYSPPMDKGAGLSVNKETGEIFLDSEHMVEFMVMSQKHKSGIDPDSKITNSK